MSVGFTCDKGCECACAQVPGPCTLSMQEAVVGVDITQLFRGANPVAALGRGGDTGGTRLSGTRDCHGNGLLANRLGTLGGRLCLLCGGPPAGNTVSPSSFQRRVPCGRGRVLGPEHVFARGRARRGDSSGVAALRGRTRRSRAQRNLFAPSMAS